MDLSDFTYDLPPELIATHPVDRRDRSRLMLVRCDGAPLEHHMFNELPNLLRPGDCLVVNDSKVLPARLHVRRPSGGQAELLLLSPLGEGVWEAIVRPARKLHPGMRLELPGGAGQAEVLAENLPENQEDRVGASERTRRIRFHLNEDVLAFLERHGEMPLPPYILHERKARGETPGETPEDRVRYQTVYASPPGSIAAPTAGLHFTPEVLEQIQQRGIEVRRVTLHVGIGTFEPITAGQVESHMLHTEHYAIGEEDAEAIEAARRDSGRRIVAVGTTTVRTLEACFARHGRIQAEQAPTNIFIYPGFQFGVVQALVTNFHLPGSTLLLLVAALAGRERILAAYHDAIALKYRFYSYGDAMLIE